MHKNISAVEWKMLQFTAVCHWEISIDFFFFSPGPLSGLAGLKLDIPGMHFPVSLRSGCQLPGNKIPVYFNTLPALWIPKNKADGQRQHFMTRISVSRKQPITLGLAAA